MTEPLAVDEISAAKLLGLSRSSVRRNRTIPFAKVGGRRLYPVDRLKAWLADRVNEQASREAA